MDSKRLITAKNDLLIQNSKEIYQAIFEAYSEGLFLETIQGEIIDCNTGACDLYGFLKSELVGMSVKDLVTEDIAETLPDIITEELTTGGIFIEAKGLKKDGTVFPTEISTKIITINAQQLVLAYVRDITRRNRLMDSIRVNEKLLHKIIDLVPHLIFARDMDGKFILANKAVTDIYSLGLEKMIGRDHRDIHYNQQEVERFLKDDQKVIRSGKIMFIPKDTYTDPDGNTRILQTTKFPFPVVNSGKSAVLSFAMDITERENKENELKVLTEKLETERMILEQKEITLREVLAHIEGEKQEYKQKIGQDIRQTMLPILKRLKDKATPDCLKDFQILETNLDAVLNEDPVNFQSRYSQLTPRELEICDMIKNRMSSKEISNTLNLSVVTVNKHREQIRKKLGLTNKEINLSTYLQIQ
jgi:PAS domain S-box-containing protein